jgi:hypothetical protein
MQAPNWRLRLSFRSTESHSHQADRWQELGHLTTSFARQHPTIKHTVCADSDSFLRGAISLREIETHVHELPFDAEVLACRVVPLDYSAQLEYAVLYR